jgi:hypothetical protein
MVPRAPMRIRTDTVSGVGAIYCSRAGFGIVPACLAF